MRAFTDGNGNDSTSAVKAYLAAHRSLLCADLFEIKTMVQGAAWSKDLLLTTFDRPLAWSHIGTFAPARLKRGTVESAISLEATSLDLEWYLWPTDMMFGSTSMLASFAAGVWDNGVVRLFRTVMPTLGDCNTFGACELFTGRIADVTITRTGVQIKVNCPLELLEQQIPANLIEPGNPAAQYGLGQPLAGLTSAPVFEAGGSSTPLVVVGSCMAPVNGQLFGADIFDFGYIQFTSGDCQGMLATVRRSAVKDGLNWFYLYDALPWTPQAGDSFNAYVPFARASSSGIQEQHAVPSSSPYEIDVTLISEFLSDAGVTYANGTRLSSAGSPGVAGQYHCDGAGRYTFCAADAGAQVIISYRFSNGGAYQGFPYVPAPEIANL
jgi:hypothetical protein